jgi:hypothetical protein
VKPLPRGLAKGVLLGLGQLVLVGTVAGTLLADRAVCPRVWARIDARDPETPLRGRYVGLNVVVQPAAGTDTAGDVRLAVEDDTLVAHPAPPGQGLRLQTGRRGSVVLAEPLAYFIPEHVRDPSMRDPGEELWAEVTVPRHGPPRPLRLGVRARGTLTPLDLE